MGASSNKGVYAKPESPQSRHTMHAPPYQKRGGGSKSQEATPARSTVCAISFPLAAWCDFLPRAPGAPVSLAPPRRGFASVLCPQLLAIVVALLPHHLDAIAQPAALAKRHSRITDSRQVATTMRLNPTTRTCLRSPKHGECNNYQAPCPALSYLAILRSTSYPEARCSTCCCCCCVRSQHARFSNDGFVATPSPPPICQTSVYVLPYLRILFFSRSLYVHTLLSLPRRKLSALTRSRLPVVTHVMRHPRFASCPRFFNSTVIPNEAEYMFWLPTCPSLFPTHATCALLTLKLILVA